MKNLLFRDPDERSAKNLAWCGLKKSLQFADSLEVNVLLIWIYHLLRLDWYSWNLNLKLNFSPIKQLTLFPHLRPTCTIFSFHSYSLVAVHRCAGIIRMRVLRLRERVKKWNKWTKSGMSQVYMYNKLNGPFNKKI